MTANPGTKKEQTKPSGSPKRFVLFDDAIEASKRFRNRMNSQSINVTVFRDPYLEEPMKDKLQDIDPDLFIVDLVIGESKTEGYGVIRQLQEIEDVKKVPIVVCSKLINDSPSGREERKECLAMPGVVEAFSKFPDFPSANELLEYAR